jgi:hypothetical protein
MIKKYLILLLFFIIIFISGCFQRVGLRNLNPSLVIIPGNAVQVSDNVFSLGTKNVNGKNLEGFVIVDYKKTNEDIIGSETEDIKIETCYNLFATGAKWKTLEQWIVNPNNIDGLDNNFIFNNIESNIQKWEDSASTDIFGKGITTSDTLSADFITPDNLNEVYFGNIDIPGVIALTVVWGVFSGDPNQREIYEWDQVYDHTDFDWSNTGDLSKIDFENIATHELGHAMGLDHPQDTCTEETMYRFTSYGETKKRTLNNGDINGIRYLHQRF